MDRQPVKSGMLKAIGYDAAKQVLSVEFADGGIYEYSGVPPEVHEKMLASDSIGKFFASGVRDQFKSKKIEKEGA